MRLAVIAANSRSGQAFVERALAAGHEIRAGVRGEHAIANHPNLTIVQCEATQVADIRQLLEGMDAVVSFIGHVHGSPKNVQTVAMQSVVKVMHDAGIRRVVSLTGTGVRYPGDKITLVDHLLNLGLSIFNHSRLNDGRNHAKLLAQNDLDWTIIRVLKLQNVKPRSYILTEHGPAQTLVSREEIASAVLQVLEQKSFIKQAPIISRG